MSYLQPHKSPCLQCDDHVIKFIDKNSDKCQLCDRRLAYILAVDPERMTVFARYSYHGGKTRYKNRDPEKNEIVLEEQEIIREFAIMYCHKNNLPFNTLINTGCKWKRIVSQRRQLLSTLKDKFSYYPNVRIADALGLKPATVNLALQSSQGGNNDEQQYA